MIIHIVTWNLNSKNKAIIGLEIKSELETLKGKIEGLINLEYFLNPLDGSNKDVMLISKHETLDDLNNYQQNPLHLNLIKKYQNFLIDRSCFNYEEKN